jgi:hypothetical protein
MLGDPSARSSIWIERLATDQEVGGSSPSGRADRLLSGRTSGGDVRAPKRDVVCELDTVASGGSVDVKVRIRPRKVGTIRNVVTVTAAETDPVPGNNTDTETTKVVA